MSGKNQTADGASEPRSQQTREALLGSLIELVATRRYDEIGVGDIVDGANVGRSTFYDHYRGKDDMLVETMGSMLGIMANVASEEDDVVPLERVLRHFLENRVFARHLFASAAGLEVSTRMTRALAVRIEQHLDARLRRVESVPKLPVSIIAAQMAQAQIAIVSAWLLDDQVCTPGAVARGMRLAALGSITALM